MARPCGWCTSRQRIELEKRVLDGEPIRLVAADTSWSESAAHRHFRNHVHPDLLRELRSTDAPLHLADFGARLVALVDETEAVREYAKKVNDGRLLLQAAGQERETLGVLMNRLGIDSSEVVDVLTDAKHLVRVFQTVLVNHPKVLGECASALHELGSTEVAESLEWLRDKGLRQIEEARTKKEQST